MAEKTGYPHSAALVQVAMAQSSSENIQAVLKSIVEVVANEVRAKGASLALLTPDKKLLQIMAAYGLSEQYMSKGPLLAEKSMREALSGEAVIVEEVITDERIQYPREAEKEGIASMLAVPIMLDEECLGVLRVYSAIPRRFTEEDINFVATAASMGAATLAKSVLTRYEKQFIDEFRNRVLEMEWGR